MPPPDAAAHPELKAVYMAAVMFRRAAAFGAASSALGIGGAVASYLGHFAVAGVLIFLALIAHVLGRAFAQRGARILGLR